MNVELKKKIIVVKLDNSNQTPSNLYGVGASLAKAFKYESIVAAIDTASNS